MDNKALQKQASQYVKIVEWSEEDGCFANRCPKLFGGGTHGADEAKVYTELCEIVVEVLSDMEAAAEAAPEPVAAQKYRGKFLLRAGLALHKALAVRAWREGKSLNQVCIKAIRNGAQAFRK